MRVLHLFIIIVVLLAIGAVGAAFFDLATVPVLSEVAYGVKGYGLAKTPDEALERFKKALEDRNYKMAARFVDGDYAVQLRQHAKVAGRLGNAIDNFRSTAKDRSLAGDKVELALAALEPFPKTIKTINVVKSESGDKATAVITSESSSRLGFKTGRAVSLKKTEDVWRIEIPLTPVDRALFDELDKNGQDYVNALDVVKNQMKTDATTKENVSRELLSELEKVDANAWRQFPR